MSDGNGDAGAMTRAIANNVTLTAMARLSMAIGTPLVTGVLMVLAYFAQGVIEESRKTREAFNDFKLNSSIAAAHTEGRVLILERRADTTDGEVGRLRDLFYRAATPAPAPRP